MPGGEPVFPTHIWFSSSTPSSLPKREVLRLLDGGLIPISQQMINSKQAQRNDWSIFIPDRDASVGLFASEVGKPLSMHYLGNSVWRSQQEEVSQAADR